MTPFLAAMLITHVIGGVIAIGIHNVALMHLLKKTPNYVFISRIAWAAVALYLLSWATSAYYYVTYYGTAVKPRILAGALPAGHIFFMEAKEHIFLVLHIAFHGAYQVRNQIIPALKLHINLRPGIASPHF